MLSLGRVRGFSFNLLPKSASLSASTYSVPARESTVAAKLKESGAIILGKANLREWSGWRDRSMPINWSARGGGVTGAYVKNQNPWASSSGSAVSGALGLSLATLGTETNGSIVGPIEHQLVDS